ncbi:MAG: NnrS family protein [Acidiferrobacterales bacterium]
MQIEEPGKESGGTGLPVFQTGFRPFFLLAGVFMIVALSTWLWIFAGDGSAPHYYGPVGWHAHEMLFGYTVAVIAGFLLTAVGNWTGMTAASGRKLIVLMALWLIGRILPWMDVLIPGWLIAVVDLLFLPGLALVIAMPLVRQNQNRNYVFILLLVLMTCANVLIHAQLLGLTLTTAQLGIDAMVYLVVLVIIIMGGRIIPFFTERGVEGATVKKRRWVEVISIASFLLLALVELADLPAITISVAAILACVSHLIRMAGWFDKRMLMVPLVWVLHSAYAWIIVGFILKALGAGQYASHALHAFTAGGIGIMTLGMMCRVALGHTGRTLEVKPVIALAFALINIAVLIRVISPIFLLGVYTQLISYAGVLFILSFLLFVWIYSPMLLSARDDGRRG